MNFRKLNQLDVFQFFKFLRDHELLRASRRPREKSGKQADEMNEIQTEMGQMNVKNNGNSEEIEADGENLFLKNWAYGKRKKNNF